MAQVRLSFHSCGCAAAAPQETFFRVCWWHPRHGAQKDTWHISGTFWEVTGCESKDSFRVPEGAVPAH